MSDAAERVDLMLTAVKRALWEERDPIGVNDAPEAHGEYDSYALTLVASLLARDHPEVIERKLNNILENIGMELPLQTTQAFALRLLQIADEVDDGMH